MKRRAAGSPGPGRRASTAVLAAAVAVLLTGPAAPAPAAAPAPDEPDLDRPALAAALAAVPAAGAPGAFAEVRAGHRTWRGAAGVADLGTGRPMRPGLRHRVGSVTKTFVATGLLQLAAEGRLRLDDPVRRWLPELARLDPRITVRMLLRQTSGLDDYLEVVYATLADIEANRAFDPWYLARVGVAMPPRAQPGGPHDYSNTNYVLAGLVLERVSGRDAAVELTRRIIRPLRLRDTYFPGAEPFIRGPHARGYVPWTDGLRDFSRDRMSWAWMAGELVSTTADLNRFYRALFGGRLLGPVQLAQLRETVPMRPGAPASGGYGLGVFWAPSPCGPVWGHDGVALGYLTVSLHSADGRRQATVAANITHYQESETEIHPIDVAVNDLLLEALCGGPDGVGPGAAGPGGSARPTARVGTPGPRLPNR
jgi:D-alanyl-D-alanine carboxypeptidase